MKKTLLVILLILFLAGLAYLVFNQKKKGNTVIPRNYEQSPQAKAEMESRVLTFENKSNPSFIFGLNDEQTFENDYFPLVNIIDSAKYGDKPKFTKGNRGINRNRIKLLVEEYDTIVSEASEVHRVPKIVIFGIMAIEHSDKVSVKSAASFINGSFIGLMQISVSTANDTLKRGVINKQLSQKQVDFFKNRIGNKIDSLSSNTLTKAELNIHSATAFLSVLISKYGLDDLHKVIFSYCQGEFKLSQHKSLNLEIKPMIDKYVGTSDNQGSQYIVRSLGQNGSFDILFNDLGIKN